MLRGEPDAAAVQLPVAGPRPARTAFDAWAGSYDESPLQALLFAPVHASVAEQVRTHAPHARRLLDVGCGTGRLLGSVAETGRQVVGVDPCRRMLERAREQSHEGTSLACARAEQLPFGPGVFDVVTSTMSLRHWRDARSGVRELARVVGPGGLLVIADADFDVPSRPLISRRRRSGSSGGCRLAALLHGGGLDVVDRTEAPVHGPVPAVHVVTACRR